MKKKRKKLFFIIMISIGIISYKKINDSKIKITDKEFIDIIVNIVYIICGTVCSR